MKRLAFLFFLLSTLGATAQEDSTYANLLAPVAEVTLTDSFYINAEPTQMSLMDSMAVKKWFSPLLGLSKNNRLKNRNYYLAGKITSNGRFDLLVLLEQKKRSDSSSVQVVYLVSTKKDGTYIASIEAAVAGMKKRSSYNISSWLYKDYKIVLDSKISVNERLYDDMTSYRINDGGRFILSGKYE